MIEQPFYDQSGERIADLVATQLSQHQDELIDEALIATIREHLAATIGLVGLSETAGIVGVTAQRISQLSRFSGAVEFPRPIAKLRNGPIYLRSEIAQFVTIPRRVGRPSSKS